MNKSRKKWKRKLNKFKKKCYWDKKTIKLFPNEFVMCFADHILTKEREKVRKMNKIISGDIFPIKKQDEDEWTLP